MIYTVGKTEAYERYFEEQDQPRKMGRTDTYSGGSVWKTYEEALEYCQDGYSVYGVMADWDQDTEPNLRESWHDLLIDADLVRLKM